MSMGSILLQPEKLKRASGSSPSTGLVEDAFNLIIQIAADCIKKGGILKILEETGKSAADRMARHFSGKIDNAWKRLRDWFKPFSDNLEDTARDIPDSDNTTQVVEFIVRLLSKLAEVAENISADRLRQGVGELLDIFQNELELTGDYVEQQVWVLLDDLADRMEQDAGGLDIETRKKRRRMASVIRRIKRKLRDQFTFPGFNADNVAEGLLDFLRQYGMEAVAKKSSCYGKNVGDIFSALNAVTEMIPNAGFGPNTVGAAEASSDGKHLWYGSWLWGGKEWESYDWIMFIFSQILMVEYPKDGFFIDNEENKLIRKKFFGSVETLGDVIDGKWWETEPFNKYSYKKIKAEGMEDFSFNSAHLPNFFETFTYPVLCAEPGDRLCGLLHFLFNLLDSIYKLFAEKPFFPWLMYIFRLCSNMLGTLTNIHTNAKSGPAFNHWFTLELSKANALNTHHTIIQTIRDALLTLFTLLNHEKSGEDNLPENHKEVGTFVTLGVVGAMLILTNYIVPRKIHGFGAFKHETGAALGWWLGGSLCAAISGATIMTFLGQIATWSYNEEDAWKVWGNQLWQSAILALIMYFFTMYSQKGGDTDGGKYNPTSSSKFKGYPAHTNSPYKLPFKKGKYVRCSQGNQGMWSHNKYADPPQVYAYDFDLDQDEEILASREGTVVNYFDWVPDDENKDIDGDAALLVPDQKTKSNVNFIVIRHDNNNTTHDKDVKDTNVITYCVYECGRKGSVRKVFNDRGVAPRSIIGTHVAQGTVIMHSGNTGPSFFNHLHIDVRPGPGVPTSAPSNPAVPLEKLEKRTIPFVFSDAKHQHFTLKDQDGVPKSLHYYKSENG